MEMGTGAFLDYRLLPPSQRNPFDQPQAGPNAILVRTAPGTTAAAADRSIDAIIERLGGHPSGGGPLLGPQRPAEVISYDNLGATTAFLGSALAAGALAGLALTLVAAVRRRRKELALLKTLGFTRGQLAAAIAWQSKVSLAVRALAGAPLGVALGRALWDLFAHGINAVPKPSTPVLTMLLIAIGPLVLANLVATVPARIAARTPTTVLLRAE